MIEIMAAESSLQPKLIGTWIVLKLVPFWDVIISPSGYTKKNKGGSMGTVLLMLSHIKDLFLVAKMSLFILLFTASFSAEAAPGPYGCEHPERSGGLRFNRTYGFANSIKAVRAIYLCEDEVSGKRLILVTTGPGGSELANVPMTVARELHNLGPRNVRTGDSDYAYIREAKQYLLIDSIAVKENPSVLEAIEVNHADFFVVRVSAEYVELDYSVVHGNASFPRPIGASYRSIFRREQ